MNPKLKSFLLLAVHFLSSFIISIITITAVFFVFIKLMGWNMFYIESASMAPKYPINTLIIVQTVEPEEIEVGDVVTYILNEDNVLVTHRVTSIDYSNKTFTTKGDANNTEDASPVFWDNVVGKVFFGIPLIGKPLQIITNENNRPIFITVIAVLLAFSIAWDIWESIKKKKSKKSAPDLPMKAEESDICTDEVKRRK